VKRTLLSTHLSALKLCISVPNPPVVVLFAFRNAAPWPSQIIFESIPESYSAGFEPLRLEPGGAVADASVVPAKTKAATFINADFGLIR
jgi:hypothetical protein